jgi:hypothetical protein
MNLENHQLQEDLLCGPNITRKIDVDPATARRWARESAPHVVLGAGYEVIQFGLRNAKSLALAPIMKDFSTSYTKADQAWAEWIAWTLEAAGYSTVIQAWDFRPGSNFVLEIQRAATEANRTIAVLVAKVFEICLYPTGRGAAFAQDTEGKTQKLIPVRIAACELTGILATIVFGPRFA